MQTEFNILQLFSNVILSVIFIRQSCLVPTIAINFFTNVKNVSSIRYKIGSTFFYHGTFIYKISSHTPGSMTGKH